jgi:hypothetical protein
MITDLSLYFLNHPEDFIVVGKLKCVKTAAGKG